jgi:hypothetical protein
VADSAPVDCEPLRASVPAQAPEAVHEVASTEVQLSVALPPLIIELGLAVKCTVGAGGLTDTLADCAALAPPPSQVRV